MGHGQRAWAPYLLVALFLILGCAEDASPLRSCTVDEAALKYTNCDLDGADLSGRDLGGADFTGATLVGADLSDTLLWAVDFTDANLTGANLDGALFRWTRFSNTICPDGTNSGVYDEEAEPSQEERPFCEPL